ncbi:DUF4332 domain-containing protein [Allorhodopirellula solitaria]|uniref:Pathogenicity locus n=1 Tax=Allorhodopirellula solitaria TaxID=2527987 RepID=A0A5C5YI29_9BACT|nr:DUF4332 domain-containing protein [Allorhodopirellula solitaria]TWT74132.1 Pathogenicity locus [Allorhodopirellula solitaria]
MLLDRIEIDSHGPLSHVELGPLSHHLNVVLGAPGSGKTAIGRFIRDSLIDRDYPRGMLSGSAGRVVWVHQNGWIHCRREQDGSPGGRRNVEFESRGEVAGSWNGYTDGWFDVAAPGAGRHGNAAGTRQGQSSLASRTLGNIRIPESIVDGVMVDTTISSPSRVVAACISAGLDQPNLAPLPFENETSHFNERGFAHESGSVSPAALDDRRRRAMRAELADVEAELGKRLASEGVYHRGVDGVGEPEHIAACSASEIETLSRHRDDCLRRRDELLRRRNELIARRDAELRERHHHGVTGSYDASEFGPVDSSLHSRRADAHWIARDARLRALHQRADSLRSRAAALQRWMAELDSHLDRQGNYPASTMEPGYGYATAASYTLPSAWQSVSSEELQNCIRQADQEIVSLRRVLADVRSLRDLLSASGRTDATVPESYDWLDDGWLRGRRYGYFVRAMDHYRSDRPWSDFYASAYQPLRPVDDLAMRIESTTRHLDWLLSRFEKPSAAAGHPLDPHSWLVENERDGAIEQSLRRVREQLRHRDYVQPSYLDATTAELNRTLDHLLARRRRVVEALAGQSLATRPSFSRFTSHHPDWTSERSAAVEELASVEQELRVVLDQTAVLRHAQRFLPIVDSVYSIGMGRTAGRGHGYEADMTGRFDAITAELRSLDTEIAGCHRSIEGFDRELQAARPRRSAPSVQLNYHSHDDITRLQRRRDELISELNRCRPQLRDESSLAELSSRWLVRLSNGRHRLIRWSTSPIAADRYTSLASDRGNPVDPDSVPGRSVAVSIDNADERSVPATTRAVAALAIRMAAGELLGRMGHGIPLVLETHRELFADYASNGQSRTAGHSNYPYAADAGAYEHWTAEGISGDAIASALADYSAAGRQLLILTEHNPLANYLQRCGARHFALHTQRVVHAHRPLWRGGQRDDRYSGPHTIGVDGLPAEQFGRAGEPDWTDAGRVNQEFDHAWRESAGLRGESYHSSTATDVPAAGAACRDGYYYTDQSSTVSTNSPMSQSRAAQSRAAQTSDVAQSLTARHHSSAISDVDDVPFFLTVDSPIDAAPSMDAVAAERLRRIGISHITHLMNQDSNRLADTLGLAGVDARTVRRWQAECRLMCRVPQLRGFDARVLVGCGITDPAQLAAIHPTDLLDRVKTFLATERGQRILLSGTSYELSRITSWIASANDSVHTNFRSRTVDGRGVRTRVAREQADAPRRSRRGSTKTQYVDNGDADLTDDDFDQERYEVQVERRAERIVDDLDELTRDYDSEGSDRHRTGEEKRSRKRSTESRSTSPSPASYRMTSEAATRSQRAERNSRRKAERSGATQSRRSSSARSEGKQQSRKQSSERTETSTETTLRFYLHRADDVVDAPSIGPRMAERLNRIGIVTVDDLLQADAAEIAERLDYRRVETSTVIEWQQQTTLVCRVPMMRGHDAQFLVAAGVTTAEELAQCSASELFELVDAIAQSSEGKRIARGGALPDLEEVTQWVQFASQHRSLQAA